MAADKKFQAWLHAQIFSKKEDGACSMLVVHHMAGKASSDVARLKVPKPESIREADTEETVLLLAEQAWELAQNDANGIGEGVQKYAIQAWFEGNAEKPLSRYTLRFGQEDDEEGNDDASVSEPPNKTGLVAQAMRHSEAFARIGTQASIHQLSMQQRTIESQQRLIEELTKDKLQYLRDAEELASQKHQRDLEMKEKEASLKLKTEALERVTNYFPLIAQKLFGRKALPAGDGKTTPTIKQFLQSLTLEQMEKARGVLDESQIALLAEMMMEQQNEEQPQPKTEGAEQPH